MIKKNLRTVQLQQNIENENMSPSNTKAKCTKGETKKEKKNE